MRTSIADYLRRTADLFDQGLPISAGRIHSSNLDGLQYRNRDLLHLAIGPVAILIDLPVGWTRERKPVRPVRDEPIRLNPDFFKEK